MKGNKWFGKCSLCNHDNKQLTTSNLQLNKIYNIWLKKMCDECRHEVLYYFYLGLYQRNTQFKDVVETFKKKNKENKK